MIRNNRWVKYAVFTMGVVLLVSACSSENIVEANETSATVDLADTAALDEVVAYVDEIVMNEEIEISTTADLRVPMNWDEFQLIVTDCQLGDELEFEPTDHGMVVYYCDSDAWTPLSERAWEHTAIPRMIEYRTRTTFYLNFFYDSFTDWMKGLVPKLTYNDNANQYVAPQGLFSTLDTLEGRIIEDSLVLRQASHDPIDLFQQWCEQVDPEEIVMFEAPCESILRWHGVLLEEISTNS